MTINVTLTGGYSVSDGEKQAKLVLFTAEADGPLFRGKTVCTGTDTQISDRPEEMTLSARYIMEGVDLSGSPCRIFIENSGTSPESCVPRIITDSKALSYLESAELYSVVEPREGGVTVKIFEK